MRRRWLWTLGKMNLPESDIEEQLAVLYGGSSPLFSPEYSQLSYQAAFDSQECIGLYVH